MSKYTMSLDLNVLNHLGINLYSNVAAVLSEVIANAWDADATEVSIKTSEVEGEPFISIFDNGNGMTEDDINNRFLKVGYQKRNDSALSPILKRAVMGRKGIGKLSLFSIAKEITIFSAKDGEKNALRMNVDEINSVIVNKNGTYAPTVLDSSLVNFEKGTLIELRSARRDFRNIVDRMKTKIARRFSVFSNNFVVKLNENPITLEDRGYFNKIKYMWHFWTKEEDRYYKDFSFDKEQTVECLIPVRPIQGDLLVEKRETFEVNGWIGSVEESGALKVEGDDLNKITVMVRGKIAKENILENIPENRLFKLYLIGELHVDFFDEDILDEMATSSRQDFNEEDPRFKDVISKVSELIKTRIASDWDEWKDTSSAERAIQNPALKEWFKQLKGDSKNQAKKLFGKIGKMGLPPKDEKEVLKQGLLAFERLQLMNNMSQLDKVVDALSPEFENIFNTVDNLEAVLYHDIVKGRVNVINELEKKVEDNEKEKLIQKYLFDHLWLLDPSWERASDAEPHMEKSVEKIFNTINDSLTEDEKSGRIDIAYKKSSGRHLIIELKKPDRIVEATDLIKQCEKYITAFEKMLEDTNQPLIPIEAVCILGKPLKGWERENRKDSDIRMLREKNIRYVSYNELISNSLKGYDAFLEKSKEISRIQKLINDL